MSRVRVPLFQKLVEIAAVLCGLVGCTVIALSCFELDADAATLPYANDGALRSKLVLENESGSDLNFGPFVIRANSAREIDDWAIGIGAATFALPANVFAYVEIVAPDGRSFLVHPLDALSLESDYQALGLRGDRGYDSFVVAFSDQPAAIGVRCYKDGAALPSTRSTAPVGPAAALVRCGDGDVRAVVTASADNIFAMVIRRNLTSGEWIVMPLRKRTP